METKGVSGMSESRRGGRRKRRKELLQQRQQQQQQQQQLLLELDEHSEDNFSLTLALQFLQWPNVALCVALVCKQWRRAARSSLLWKYFGPLTFGNIIGMHWDVNTFREQLKWAW